LIEGSKSFAKDVMEAAGVSTARRLEHAVAPCVLKADGLAAGKGVFVCRTPAELEAGLEAVQALGQEVVVEELLEGPELSLFALCDGERAVGLPPAQDFKRAFDGDEGPNTGGMGAYCPVPDIGAGDVDQLLDTVHRPVLSELRRRGAPFVGLLYAGLMLTAEGPRVIEFNCRFGDPETQAILPLLESDLLQLLAAAAAGDLRETAVDVAQASAVTVVMAAGSYPGHGDHGSRISGVAGAEAAGALVFHAGTEGSLEELYTDGGRVLAVTGRGGTLEAARRVAYEGVSRISFQGARHRADIAEVAARTG
jgi:phosphoribosylamine--glycine ligase